MKYGLAHPSVVLPSDSFFDEFFVDLREVRKMQLMLRRFSLVLSALAILQFSFTEARAEEAPLDIAKINQVIALVVAPIVAETPEISDASLVLDAARTSVTENRLGLTLSTTLKQSNWSTDPTTFTASVGLAAAIAEHDGQRMADLNVDLGIGMQTAAVPALKYAAQAARALMDCDSVTGDPATSSKAFVCAQLAESASVSDLAQLSMFMVSFKDGLERLLNGSVADLEQRLASAQDETARQAIQKELASARATLAFVGTLGMDVAFTDTGAVRELAVRATGTLDLGMAQISNLSLTIQDQNVALAGKVVAVGLITETDFNRYRDDLVSVLRGVEAGDAAAMGRVREMAQLFISLVVGYTNQ